MTCINCPIEITSMHLYTEGVHVGLTYRDWKHNFYFGWRYSEGKRSLNFFTFIRLLGHVAHTTLDWGSRLPA